MRVVYFQLQILTRLDGEPRPTFYHQELHMLDFTVFNRTRPVFMSLIRDPGERFRSRFAWARKHVVFRY